MTKKVTTTQLVRNLGKVLQAVSALREEVLVARNNQLIARIVPGVQQMSVLEAMADLHKTITPSAAKNWVKRGMSSRRATLKDLEDPWNF